MTQIKWNYLTEPFLCRDWHTTSKGPPPFVDQAGILLLIKSEEGLLEHILLGDWVHFSISTDEGCGCCSESRYDKILAWADLTAVVDAVAEKGKDELPNL